MAARISKLVNASLADEGESAQLATSDILDLIDLGRSEGGSEVLRHYSFANAMPSDLECHHLKADKLFF